MSRVAVFHPGVQHSWQTALALQDLGLLEFYATTMLYQPDRWPFILERLPGTIGRRLAASFSRIAPPRPFDPHRIRTHGVIEYLERLANRAGWPAVASRLDRIGNDRFGDWIGKQARSPRSFALWGYNNSSLRAFTAARASGRRLVLDQTIGHPRYFDRILAEQYALHPQWFASPPPPIDPALAERNDAELELADRIVVGSAFCGQTLLDASTTSNLRDKLHVLPYCFDPSRFTAPLRPPRPTHEPLRILFVGQIGIRKGAHMLLEAMARISPSAAQLTLLGGQHLHPAEFARHVGRVTVLGSVPRSAVNAIMADHDILILPSFYEGSALVLLEALASGMGIIQSRAAGNGATAATGLVLDDLSVETVHAAIMEAVDNRQRVEEWRLAARAEAKRYGFDAYRAGIARLVETL